MSAATVGLGCVSCRDSDGRPLLRREEEENDDEEEELVVEPGVRVELQGLVNAAQHNGKHGVVRSVDEKNGGRFVVELEADGALLSIKPENLIPRARL